MSLRTDQGTGRRAGSAATTTNGSGTPRGVASARERFEARRARARYAARRPRRVLWGMAGLLVVLVAAGWVLLASPWLTVQTVAVTGLTDKGEQAAARAAAAIAPGTPLARVDSGAASRRVAAIPTVAAVTVVRSWPHTVTVEVTRKTPVVAVRTPDGAVHLVDAQGSTYQQVASVPAGVPLVSSSTATPDPDGLRAATSVLTLLPAALRAQVSAVTVSSADLVTFTLGTVKVSWGGVADGPKKVAVLQALLKTTPATIDVSAPDTPTTT